MTDASSRTCSRDRSITSYGKQGALTCLCGFYNPPHKSLTHSCQFSDWCSWPIQHEKTEHVQNLPSPRAGAVSSQNQVLHDRHAIRSSRNRVLDLVRMKRHSMRRLTDTRSQGLTACSTSPRATPRRVAPTRHLQSRGEPARNITHIAPQRHPQSRQDRTLEQPARKHHARGAKKTPAIKTGPHA